MARLTHDIIVTAAIEVIADVGPEQFSVRRLGEALDADPTAIYRHFRSTDELLRAVGDRSLEGLADDLPASSWRDCVRELCIRIRAANLAQPALASLVRGAPPRHRNELLITETILRELRTAGFVVHDATRAYHAVIELTIGSAAIDSTMAAMPAAERERMYEDWRSHYAALDPATFPCSVESAPALYPETADRRFEYALDRLLDGLAASIAPSADTES
jgi:AcrR family transcriptional regulator